MKTDFINEEIFNRLLHCLCWENELALRTSLATGLRINDVLSLKTAQIEQKQRFTVKEEKTDKRRRIYIPTALVEDLRRISGRVFVFEGRLSYNRHRTRQAVFKDLKRVTRLYRLNSKKIKENIAPHTARKIFAVAEYKKSADLLRVKQLMNHADEAVTYLYALADVITSTKYKKRRK